MGSAAKEETRRTTGVIARGRSERVVKSVLEAAVVELAESGYSAFRIEQVAAKAGVNKTTIYRRWPTKTELVGALRWKLTFKRRIEERAWARIIAEKHIPEVAAITQAAVREGSGHWLQIVARAVARGELPKHTEAQLLLDMVKLVIDERFRCSEGKIEDAVVVAVVRTVIAGAKAGTLVRRREERA